MRAETGPGTGRRPPLRGLVIFIVAVVALGVGWLAFVSVGTPSEMSVAELVDDEQEFPGEVTVEGFVDQVYENGYMTIVDRGFLGLFKSEPLLVVLPPDVSGIAEGGRVVVTGVVERAVELGVPARILEQLEDDPFHAADIHPAVRARTVSVDD